MAKAGAGPLVAPTPNTITSRITMLFNNFAATLGQTSNKVLTVKTTCAIEPTAFPKHFLSVESKVTIFATEAIMIATTLTTGGNGKLPVAIVRFAGLTTNTAGPQTNTNGMTNLVSVSPSDKKLAPTGLLLDTFVLVKVVKYIGGATPVKTLKQKMNTRVDKTGTLNFVKVGVVTAVATTQVGTDGSFTFNITEVSTAKTSAKNNDFVLSAITDEATIALKSARSIILTTTLMIV